LGSPAAKPYKELASTGYCLANSGKEYLVYLPDGDQVTLDLSASSGVFQTEWMDPVQGKIISDKSVIGGMEDMIRIWNEEFGV